MVLPRYMITELTLSCMKKIRLLSNVENCGRFLIFLPGQSIKQEILYFCSTEPSTEDLFQPSQLLMDVMLAPLHRCPTKSMPVYLFRFGS